MARSNSVINVSIIGDAKKLIGALNQVDTASGGLIKSAVKLVAGTAVVRKGFDLLGDSLHEADRRGDALQRLNAKLGPLAENLVKTSDQFAKIGASSQDVLELEAQFTDMAEAAALGSVQISKNAEAVSVAAFAMAQVHDADPTAILDAIGKAVGGSTRGLKEYGVNLTADAVALQAMAETGKDNAKQLTAQELASARLTLILREMNPVVTDITKGTGDFAQKQDELGAKFETVMGKIGAGVEGPLADVLTFINDEIDAIPGAIEGWQMLGKAIEDFGRAALGPLGNVRDVLEGILNLLGQVSSGANTGQSSGLRGRQPGARMTDREINAAYVRERERNGLGI